MTSSVGSENARLCIPMAARSAMPVPLWTYITFRYSRGLNETFKPASPLFLNNTKTPKSLAMSCNNQTGYGKMMNELRPQIM